jgi:orotate phosphoribosyltransferase
MDLVPSRRGHFRLESGYHASLWLELDTLFLNASRIEPLVAQLSSLLRKYEVDAICGPMRGGAFLAQSIARALKVEFWFTERSAPTNGVGMFQVTYPLPRAFAMRARNRRVAIVDDIMSAGSALRGTYAEMEKYGANTVAAGALLILGSAGAGFFTEKQIPVEALDRQPFDLWQPLDCRLCADGVPLEDTL